MVVMSTAQTREEKRGKSEGKRKRKREGTVPPLVSRPKPKEKRERRKRGRGEKEGTMSLHVPWCVPSAIAQVEGKYGKNIKRGWGWCNPR
jgi:hypothetical protein